MAAITSANVVISNQYEFGSRSSKFIEYRMIATITLAAQGGTAGDIPASAFGLKQITNVRDIACTIGGNPRHCPMQIANFGLDGNYIYPLDPTQATDASRTTPANITGTVVVEISGIPANS